MALAFDTSGTGHLGGLAGSTTGSVDITSAATGSLVLVLFSLRNSISVTAFSGWTSAAIRATNSVVSDFEVWYRFKVAGDTTFSCTVSSSQVGIISWASYTGVDTTTPIESAGSAAFTNTSYTTPSETPTTFGRWAVGFFSGVGGSATTNITYPTPSGLVSRVQDFDKPTSGNVPSGQIADSNSTVAVSPQAFTSVPTVTGSTAGSGAAGLLFLVPAASGVTVTGVVSTAAWAAPNGVVSVGLNAILSGVVVNAAVASPAGTVTTTKTVNLAGPKAGIFVAAPAPAKVGFCSVSGTQILNGSGTSIKLRGVGLGTWLLWEQWMMGLATQTTNGQTQMLTNLTSVVGSTDSNQFYLDYQNTLITEQDIYRIAELGYNTIRVAFNSNYKDSYVWLDKIISWAEAAGIYVVLDMHAAIRAQNGFFIADSPDGTPHMWNDVDGKTVVTADWVNIATRYASNTTVLGYGLLNEPYSLAISAATFVQWYQDTITAIRGVDANHIIFITGLNFSHDTTMWTTPLTGGNIVLEYHQYITDSPAYDIQPGLNDARTAAVALGNIPIWIGEMGQDDPASTLFQKYAYEADSTICGWSYWSWKQATRADGRNSVMNYTVPATWQPVIDYIGGKSGATAPTASDARIGMADFLAAIKTATENPDLIAALKLPSGVSGIHRDWHAVSLATATAGTSATIDISGCPNGDWIFICFNSVATVTAASLGLATNGTSPITTLQAQTTYGSSTGSVGAWAIKKASGDTTLTISWTTSRQYTWAAVGYSGLSSTGNAFDGWTFTSLTGASSRFTSAASDPTGSGDWGLAFFGGADGNANTTQPTWTPSVPLVEIDNIKQNTFTHPVIESCDTNGNIVDALQQYSSKITPPGGLAVGNGFAAILFLNTAPTTAISGVVANSNLAAPAGSVSVTIGKNISGVVATIATAAPAGGKTVSLTGVVANATAVAPAGSISTSTDGVLASATWASPAGSLAIGPTLVGSAISIQTQSPAGNVSGTANITGVVATAAWAAPAGSHSTTLAGVVSTATWAPSVGAISGAVNGPVSTAAWAAPAGAKTTTLTGVVATINSQAPAGSLSLGVSVIGVVANWTAAAPAGGISGSVPAIVANANWSASSAGIVNVGVTITGVVATLTTRAPAGVAGVVTAVTGLLVNSNVVAPAGSVTIITSITVTGVVSAATFAATAGAITGAVNGVPATASWSGVAGGVSGSVNGVPAALTTAPSAAALLINSNMSGVVVTSVWAAPIGIVVAQQNRVVTGVSTAINSAAFGGTIFLSQSLTGVPATAIWSGANGVVHGDANITGVTATINVAAPAGTVFHNAQIIGLAANTTAIAIAGIVKISSTIAGVRAQSNVVAPAGVIVAGIGINGPAALITFDAIDGAVTIARFFASAAGHTYSDGECFMTLVETLGVVQLNMVPAPTISVEDG